MALERTRLHVHIEKDSFDWLKDFSEENGLSLGETVRRVIAEFRYRQGKRDNVSKLPAEDLLGQIDGPTEAEDSLHGLAKRVMHLEMLLLKVCRDRHPVEVPQAELYPYIPDYMKL